LQGPKQQIRFERIAALAAGDRQPVWMMVTEDGTQVPSRAIETIYRMFQNRQLVTGSKGAITYSDVNGRQYRTTLTYDFDEFSREVIMKFARWEPEASAEPD
jgi:hypothetical protein